MSPDRYHPDDRRHDAWDRAIKAGMRLVLLMIFALMALNVALDWVLPVIGEQLP